MQISQNHIAFVDEYGGIAGMVTIEDIVGIVGEMVDEHDHAQPEIEEISDGVYRVPARMIDDIVELFDIDLTTTTSTRSADS